MRFHQLEECIASYPDNTFGILPIEERKKYSDHLLQTIRNSQKFYLGDIEAAAIPVDPYRGPFLKLPYPATAVEYFEQLPGKSALRVINLAWTNADDVVEFALFFSVFSGQWTYACRGVDLGEGKLSATSFGRNDDEASQSRTMVASQFTVLANFLAVLNCVNVNVLDVEAPKFRNAQRARSRKTPIYRYHVLVLRPSKARGETLGGTHASPAIHLRRGHIKRRKTGNFWWQPCVVGNRKQGVVMKDYRADELLSNSIERNPA